MTSNEWVHLGNVTIDSAHLMLIDPMHTDYFQDAAVAGEIGIPDGDHSAVVAHTGLGDGRYAVEARFIDCGPFGRRCAEVRVKFLDFEGNWLGEDVDTEEADKNRNF